MSETLTIDVNLASDYKSITITDDTDWSVITGTIDSLTSVTLSFYTTTTESSDYTYEFTATDLANYTNVGYITLTFETMFGREYAIDNWYEVQMNGNSDDYLSNYAGFGTDVYITSSVYDNINSLHTPESYKYNIEPLALQIITLNAMKYLDTSTINDRSIKWKKDYNYLIRANS